MKYNFYKNVLVFIIGIFGAVSCQGDITVITPLSAISSSTAINSTPTATLFPTQMPQWHVFESVASEGNPIEQDNSTSEWAEKIIAESISFTGEFQIKLNMQSIGANGILLTGNMPGDPWWKGHKRLEVFYNTGSIAINIRDGTQEEPAYSNIITLLPVNGNVTTGEILLSFDKQAKNIQIQYENRIILQLNLSEIGDFPEGLFPDNNILDVSLSSNRDSSVTLSELEFLIPDLDYSLLESTQTPVSGLPISVIPNGMGVNIHFLSGYPLDLDLIAQAGFKFVRADAYWYQIERSKGVYDFSDTDILVKETEQRNMRVMFLLSSANPLYDGGVAPYTEDGWSGFAKFAGAMAAHYAGKGILWDIWTEPNGVWSWKPKPNIQDYAKMVSEAIPAIRNADSTAVILGPGICCFEMTDSWYFYDELGRQGLLSEFDAVSIHSYNFPVLKPEDVPMLYSHLRQILDKYSLEKEIPIVEDEYGYSTAWDNIDDSLQAEYLVRSWLINLANDVNLSTWYDWKDDGSDKNNPEHNFGIVYLSGQPKPSYLAAQTFMQTLNGFQFARRIPTPNPANYLLIFNKENESILVAWTVNASHEITFSVDIPSLTSISMLGEKTILTSDGDGFQVELSNSPQYILLGIQTLQ